MTKMEQIAGKSEHLLEDRGFVCFVWVGFGFFLPPSRERGGNAFHYSTQFMQNPLLSVDYCIMQYSVFKLG